ncbi:MAG: methionyl-tRNA formyltransferase [Alcaligenaceae bacterium]|uniref:Methionyl-tRNA formyltransferase n=1 Tax=Paenalcaligenes hermetiae TaxID=1157987 RepID=A0ABP9LSS3_9BURK|nr:methionyl-tRNA formyltransferase [Alcaligenaceae bacterium]
MTLKVVFAGTPDFARLALEAILAAGHQVPLVLTQPDRPSGRGMKLRPSPVKQAALDAGIPVAQPLSLRLDGKHPDEAQAVQQQLQAIAPDVMVVAAYGLILPQWALDLPKYGCLNIHASLLPRWRGAAPIQRAIDAGDAETGITIMQMDAGLDTGDMLLVRKLAIQEDHTGASLHDELAQLGADAIVEALAQLPQLTPTPQPADGVTYAEKLHKSESPLDFTQPAAVLARRVRAFNPVPSCTMMLPGLEQPIKVWQAQAIDQPTTATPGSVVAVSAQGIDIATADGVLRLTELQRAGSRRQPVASFVQGWQLPA